MDGFDIVLLNAAADRLLEDFLTWMQRQPEAEQMALAFEVVVLMDEALQSGASLPSEEVKTGFQAAVWLRDVAQGYGFALMAGFLDEKVQRFRVVLG